MIQNEIYYKSLNNAKEFNNSRIIQDIELLERLIDNDDFRESIFIDQALEMYEAYRDECVRRIKNAIQENSNLGRVSTLASLQGIQHTPYDVTINIGQDNNGEIKIGE